MLISDTPVLELLNDTIRAHLIEAERNENRAAEADDTAAKARAAAARYRAAIDDMREALERLFPATMLAEAAAHDAAAQDGAAVAAEPDHGA